MKKSEKGIRILAPIGGIKRKRDDEANKVITKQKLRCQSATALFGSPFPLPKKYRGFGFRPSRSVRSAYAT